MSTQPTSEDIDRMIQELKEAGWTQAKPVFWRAPNGALYLGPAGAWSRMKQSQRSTD